MLSTSLSLILQNSWLVLIVTGVILVLATEFGFRIGSHQSVEKREKRRGESSALQGAMLGLLGLLLGFSFAMSAQRFDARKQLVLDEANAIGTCWLRTNFLSDPARDKMRTTLSDYVDVRLKGAAIPFGSSEFQKLLAQSGQDQTEMWEIATAEAKANNTPSMSLFVSSLNDVIDMDGKRQAGARNHVPQEVWLLLLLVSCSACWTTGYTTALGGSGRHILSMIILPALLSFVIAVIADLDDPHGGMIRVSQQSMMDLQKSLR